MSLFIKADRVSPPPHHQNHNKKIGSHTATASRSGSGLIKDFTNPTRLSLLGKDRVVTRDYSIEDDDDMSTGFLSFCAVCDKQIVVPSNSILYCSESCKHKDSRPANIVTAMPSPTRIEKTSPETSPIQAVVRPRLPSTIDVFDTKAIALHDAKPDLDPTEWKPAEPHTSATRPPDGDLTRRPSSEAFTYLSQFHRSTSSVTLLSCSESKKTPRRPVLKNQHRGSSVFDLIAQDLQKSCINDNNKDTRFASTTSAPSLIHSPTTSTNSADSSLVGTPENSPPRHGSTSGGKAKDKSGGEISIEITSPVITVTPPPTYSSTVGRASSALDTSRRGLLSEKIAALAEYGFPSVPPVASTL